jgi:phthalate 4,5-dioxygenase oxygenase subunit
MLSAEQNALLTQTGPGTPMGRLFRSYWLPALLASELPENDCPPVRIELLSESLLAWRDSEGRYSLMEEFCPHRRTSLWLGRNEESGLRCPYHGWKFDWTGQCVEIPSEPDGSKLCERIKITSYPLVKRGDLLWAYMGAPDRQPPLPEWEFCTVPVSHSYTSKRLQECNWLQALEGGIDSSHTTWLHRGELEIDPLFKGSKGNAYNLGDTKPQFDVVESDGGLLIGARRDADGGQYYWRITQWILPCVTMIAPRAQYPAGGHFWVPKNDESCWVWNWDYHATHPLSDYERTVMQNGAGRHVIYEAPNSFRARANKDNDYMIDRAAQKSGKYYSGIAGFAMQDSSVQELMGPIVDRSRENLVSTDRGVVMARRRLMSAAKSLWENDTAPPGVSPEHQRVRAVSILLPRDVPLKEGASEHLTVRPNEPHASV